MVVVVGAGAAAAEGAPVGQVVGVVEAVELEATTDYYLVVQGVVVEAVAKSSAADYDDDSARATSGPDAADETLPVVASTPPFVPSTYHSPEPNFDSVELDHFVAAANSADHRYLKIKWKTERSFSN